MRQLRINFFLMHIKPSCTGSSQSTNPFLFSKGQSKKLERNISCCASSKLWEILHYPNGSGEKLKETWPDFQLLEVLSNPKFSPAPQNCCECHTSANYINWLNGIAQPLAHTESFLMMHFYLLCCPAHLPASPRLANISTLSSVSQENVYSRLCVIFWSGLLFQKVRFADGLPPCADVQHLLFMERCCPDVWCFKGKWLLLTGTWFYLLWQSLWALNPF